MDMERQSENWLWRPEGTGSDEPTELASSDDALEFGPHLKAHSPGPTLRFECAICSRPIRPDSVAQLRRPLASRVAAGEGPLIVAELLGIRDDAGLARPRACTVVMRLRCTSCGCRGVAEISCSMESQLPR